MFKLIACITLSFAVLVAVNAGPRPGPPQGGRGGGPRSESDEHGGGRRPGSGDKGPWTNKLCSNTSYAQAFVTQTRQLITNLQSNGSFTDVLNERASEVAYLQNTSNDGLLTSNCTAYFSGLESARQTDRTAVEAKQQYFRAAQQAFFEILRSIIGNNRY